MRRIETRYRPGGLTYREAVNVARKRVKDGETYLIRRHGGWFRPNAQGYCTSFGEAGVFDAATARSYLEVEGLSVVPLSEVRDCIHSEMAQLDRQMAQLDRQMAALRALANVI